MKPIKNTDHTIFRAIPPSIADTSEADPRTRVYLTPQRVLWERSVQNSGALLENRSPQISLDARNACVLLGKGGETGLLLDFGMELHGGIMIFAWKENSGEGANVRVRFGESAMEAMSDIGGDSNATNDHANRDITLKIGAMSMTPVGETGFRFVRIDLLDEGGCLELKAVKGVLVYKDIPYRGSFRCSDPLLTRIWDVGAYTVHLNMQGYLWDGIKRDRMVWVGDLHPETTTIQTVFGYDDSVPKSLNFARDETPLPGWMNGFPAYSMWWVIVHHDWFMHTGDLNYLASQKDYLIGLHRQLSAAINPDGKDATPDVRFIDWPTFRHSEAVDAGLQALHVLAAEKLRMIFLMLNENRLAEECLSDLAKLRRWKGGYGGAKQAAALLVIAGLKDAALINDEILRVGGARGMSTFMGYYILTARAMAGDIQGCLDCIRDYWGGMLSLGATTFWEDFNIEWLKNAAPIDQVITGDEVNVHASYGGHCYQGYRHSLCHGWAAGATPWLTENVLGIKILKPGCRELHVSPHLGDLQWAEGCYPTPFGEVYLRCDKATDGTVQVQVDAPEDIKVTVDNRAERARI